MILEEWNTEDAIAFAREEGREDGRVEGIEVGIGRGREEGLVMGREEGRVEVCGEISELLAQDLTAEEKIARLTKLTGK